MSLEKSPPEEGKKVWNIVRIVMYMMRKGICKSKMMLDIHLVLKKWKTASSKAIGSLILHHHYSALTCRSDDIKSSFVSPREYEFSCSNTPVYHSKLRSKSHHQYYREEEVRVMQKVFDILRRYDAADQASPLPGFGRSPVAGTAGSPFSVKDAEEIGHQVDKDAEEFIKKFYKDLKNQKRIAALESPSPYHVLGR